MRSRDSDNMQYSPAEREDILRRMRSVSHIFYAGAVTIQNHPFIEFCGLMNEYIKMCEDAHAAGIDFTQCNTHSGQALPMQPHHARYLAEKLDCIYGPSLRENPELAREFLRGLGLAVA